MFFKIYVLVLFAICGTCWFINAGRINNIAGKYSNLTRFEGLSQFIRLTVTKFASIGFTQFCVLLCLRKLVFSVTYFNLCKNFKNWNTIKKRDSYRRKGPKQIHYLVLITIANSFLCLIVPYYVWPILPIILTSWALVCLIIVLNGVWNKTKISTDAFYPLAMGILSFLLGIYLVMWFY